MKRPVFSVTMPRALRVLLVLLIMFLTVSLGALWRSTVQAGMVPGTIVPFSDLRRFQQMAEALRPERLRSGERLQFEYSAEDLQKIATLLANGHPRTARTQFEILVTPLAVSIQVWWPTGIRERYLPVRIVWHPDQPASLQRFYVGRQSMPSWIISVINTRIDAGAGGDQIRAIWRQYNPLIELHHQRLTLELEFQQTKVKTAPEQG